MKYFQIRMSNWMLMTMKYSEPLLSGLCQTKRVTHCVGLSVFTYMYYIRTHACVYVHICVIQSTFNVCLCMSVIDMCVCVHVSVAAVIWTKRLVKEEVFNESVGFSQETDVTGTVVIYHTGYCFRKAETLVSYINTHTHTSIRHYRTNVHFSNKTYIC